MRNQENGSLKGAEGLLEDVGACYVQVVGRLVEAQQRSRRDEHLGQGETTLLAAGENTYLLLDCITLEEKRTE